MGKDLVLDNRNVLTGKFVKQAKPAKKVLFYSDMHKRIDNQLYGSNY